MDNTVINQGYATALWDNSQLPPQKEILGEAVLDTCLACLFYKHYGLTYSRTGKMDTVGNCIKHHRDILGFDPVCSFYENVENER